MHCTVWEAERDSFCSLVVVFFFCMMFSLSALLAHLSLSYGVCVRARV